MVGANVDAVFRCQYPTADAIVWRVNGSIVAMGKRPPNTTTAATSDGSGTLVYTLTILALPEYNRTEVECDAITSSLTEGRSPLVTLLIQGILLYYPQIIYYDCDNIF